MFARSLSIALLFGTPAAFAKDRASIVYTPPASQGDERPVATSIVVGPQGNDYAFRVDFNGLPWGAECKNRCANATIFLDTDNNTKTGLQLGQSDSAETGADLSV